MKQAILDEVVANLPLSVLVNDMGVPLRPASAGPWQWQGDCPFHHAPPGSTFRVSNEKNKWSCLHCNSGGDIFGFVMQRTGLPYTTVVASLLGRVRMKVAAQDLQAAATEALR